MIFSRGRPISSAASADSSADCTIASRITSLAVSGEPFLLVLVHQPGQQLLVERAPVDADAHRLVVADRHLDDRRELLVLLFLEADIAGIDAVLGERCGAGRMVGEQPVADIVEVADQRHVDAEPLEPLADCRDGGGTLVAVDGDAHDLGAGAVQRGDLRDRLVDVGRVGVGHRLDDHGCGAADDDAADVDRNRFPAREGRCKISGHGGGLFESSDFPL